MDALRSALAQSTNLFSFLLGGTVDEQTAAAEGVPQEFLGFCRVLDGASCNPSVQLFGLSEAREHQFYCTPVVDSPLPLSPATLFCIGTIHDTPVFLDRAGGGILGIPMKYYECVDVERFEVLAARLEEFFLERLATPEFARLALIDDELAEHDDWLTFAVEGAAMQLSVAVQASVRRLRVS